MLNFKERLPKIKTFLFDVDGVLTNDSVQIMPDGELVRNMNSKDRYAMQLAVKKGYRIAIITGGNSNAVKNTLNLLGIKDVFLSQHNKMSCYEDYILEHDLKEDEIVYMGDDLPDYDVMKRVGIAACPNNSAHEIKEISIYISNRNGGEACVRDIIEQVMRSQDTWEISGW
jgi:3-deoxy-D-manno-octulosonate 8-phosphate phosphatase (KDO 8-P phosphatase)